MSRLLVGVGKPDQLPFAPGASENLKTNRQIFADETHGYNYDWPLRSGADERELALRRLAAVSVDFGRKCPDWKDKRIDTCGVHCRSECVAIHLLVLAALDRGGIFLWCFCDGGDFRDASGM